MAPHREPRTAWPVLCGLGMMYIKRLLSTAIILSTLGVGVGTHAFADPPCKTGILLFGTSVCLPSLFPKTPKTPTIDAPIILKPPKDVRPKPRYPELGPNLPRYPELGPNLPRYPVSGQILQAKGKQQKRGQQQGKEKPKPGDQQPKGKKKSPPNHDVGSKTRSKRDKHQGGERRVNREMAQGEAKRQKTKDQNTARNQQRGKQQGGKQDGKQNKYPRGNQR